MPEVTLRQLQKFCRDHECKFCPLNNNDTNKCTAGVPHDFDIDKIEEVLNAAGK